ncbi:hypothetical protein [Sphingomonas solaris]|uniref:Uncharacterized protein n=1 Tax=Alterirhizorhabdus solaris TaxID=2529389 RepID=A0A558R974_9SPHN|nr:hypothetical protein [Sphingomonas solaris]TVV75927.1 hypothetical protein FOY91_05625 [Sphingomonas solaris]
MCALRARLRIALIRRWRTLPMGDHFHFEVETVYQKRVLMDQFVMPSRDVIALLQIDVPEGAYPNARWVGPNAPPSLLNSAFLSRVAGAAAHQAFGPMIGAEALRKARYSIDQWLTARLEPLAATSNADLAAQGLGRRSFVEDRIGVSASQGSVIVAVWLVEARTRIEACMQAVETGSTLPSATDALPSFARSIDGVYKPMAPKWVTEGLRRMGKPDNNSERTAGDLDVEKRSSFQLVQRTLDAFAVSCPGPAVRALMIDPADIFA